VTDHSTVPPRSSVGTDDGFDELLADLAEANPTFAAAIASARAPATPEELSSGDTTVTAMAAAVAASHRLGAALGPSSGAGRRRPFRLIVGAKATVVTALALGVTAAAAATGIGAVYLTPPDGVDDRPPSAGTTHVEAPIEAPIDGPSGPATTRVHTVLCNLVVRLCSPAAHGRDGPDTTSAATTPSTSPRRADSAGPPADRGQPDSVPPTAEGSPTDADPPTDPGRPTVPGASAGTGRPTDPGASASTNRRAAPDPSANSDRPADPGASVHGGARERPAAASTARPGPLEPPGARRNNSSGV
jgi:hypothetical protein